MDPLTAQLRQLCPALFSEDDAIASKGHRTGHHSSQYTEYSCDMQNMLRDIFDRKD